jgi:hypothetical protein
MLHLQPSDEMHSAHSALVHTFCDELLATIALCVQSVRAQHGAAQSGVAAVPFGLFHATASRITDSESWPGPPAQGSSDSGNLICEVDLAAACSSSLLGWLLQVLHHTLLLYMDALQPCMRTVAQLLLLCLPLCPIQQLSMVLASLTVLLRSCKSLHTILIPSVPGIFDVCMFVLSEGSATCLTAAEGAAPVPDAALVSAACACMHVMLSMQAHKHQILPPHWQLIQAVAAALKHPHQAGARHLLHRLLLMCGTPLEALAHLNVLPDAALQSLERNCSPLRLEVCRTSIKQQQTTKVCLQLGASSSTCPVLTPPKEYNGCAVQFRQSKAVKRARLDHCAGNDPVQQAGAAKPEGDIGGRVSQLQHAASVLACFCAMVCFLHFPTKAHGMHPATVRCCKQSGCTLVAGVCEALCNTSGIHAAALEDACIISGLTILAKSGCSSGELRHDCLVMCRCMPHQSRPSSSKNSSVSGHR